MSNKHCSSVVPCETPASSVPSGEGNYLIYKDWGTNAAFLFCNHLLIALILKSGFGKINEIQPSLISLQEQCTLQKSGIPEPAVPLPMQDLNGKLEKAFRKTCAMEKGEFPASIHPVWF